MESTFKLTLNTTAKETEKEEKEGTQDRITSSKIRLILKTMFNKNKLEELLDTNNQISKLTAITPTKNSK